MENALDIPLVLPDWPQIGGHHPGDFCWLLRMDRVARPVKFARLVYPMELNRDDPKLFNIDVPYSSTRVGVRSYAKDWVLGLWM